MLYKNLQTSLLRLYGIGGYRSLSFFCFLGLNTKFHKYKDVCFNDYNRFFFFFNFKRKLYSCFFFSSDFFFLYRMQFLAQKKSFEKLKRQKQVKTIKFSFQLPLRGQRTKTNGSSIKRFKYFLEIPSVKEPWTVVQFKF